MSVSIELPPHERSAVVRQVYDDFTSNELISFIHRFTNQLAEMGDPEERRPLRDDLNILLSVAHQKGFTDVELKLMAKRRWRPLSWEVLGKRKIVNLADYKWRRKLAARRLQQPTVNEPHLTPVPSNMRYIRPLTPTEE